MKRLILPLAAWLLVACATSSTAPATDPAAQERLRPAIARRDAALKRFESIAPGIREQCRQSDGDCMIDVLERRKRLTGGRTFYQCDREADEARRARCEEDSMVELGKAERVIDYYEAHAWCLEQMAACAPKLVEAAEAAAKQTRYEQRKQEIEASLAAAALRGAVDLAVTQVDFARSVLPPSAQDACTSLPGADACLKKVQEDAGAYDQLLGGEPATYDAQAATAAHERALRSEQSCYEPELECLIAAGAKYGAEKQTRAALSENLALLEQRQQLLGATKYQAGQDCIRRGQAEHQERVADVYRHYARRPITYFRLQLLRAFLKLHRTQIECLEGQATAAPSAAPQPPP